MPEDDINAAVAQLTTEADLVRMHQHLESIQSYAKHQHARIDKHLAIVRSKLLDKGTGEVRRENRVKHAEAWEH